jgi:type I restriction enzyme S subunit
LTTPAEWPIVELGVGLSVRHGFAFKGEFFCESGDLIVLTPGNFHEGGGFKLKSNEKFYDGPVPDGYLLRRGDVVVAMTEQSKGLLGSTATVPADGTFLHNQRLGLLQVTDSELLDLRYCYHLLNTPGARNQIQATATGSKVRHTAPERIQAVRIPLPDLEYQRKIAGALDSIETLIENNRRRIEILQEMARLIYREWFVHFRFPTHEDVEFVNSDLGPVPKGWEARTLGALASLNERSLRKGDDVGEILYVDISSVGPRTIEPPEAMDFSDAPGRARRLVAAGNTIWSTVRPNRRSHVLLVDPPSNLVCSTGFAVLTAKAVPSSFLFEMTSTDEFTAHLTGLATGSAYPAVRPPDFECYALALPPADLLGQFDRNVGPMHRLQHTLSEQNRMLSEVRDLLLPRLISGELDVSDLDLDLEPVA